MIELRDYQRELLERVDDALERADARIMLQLPTGGGKTRIAGALLSGWLKDGRKAVWLTHRKELASQTAGMLQEAGVPATANILWNPGADAPTIANGVVILMAQTVSRRNVWSNVWGGYDPSDLMIIDEAHHATADGWERAIHQWPGPVLGMTATPWRLSQREGFNHLFTELHCGPQVAALQLGKWLSQARVLLPPEEQRVQGGQVDSTGDYSESSIELANKDGDVWTAGALRFWRKHCEDRQTVVYAVSKGHARSLGHVFKEAAIPVGVLLGDTPNEERARLIEQFQDGTVRALVNVAVATEGFDLPDAACVVLTRPTMSLSLYLQMVGRGLRPKQNDGNCMILDLAENVLRHGRPEEEREWSLQPRGEQPSGESPVVRCPECESVSPAGSHQCGTCGAPFGEHCSRCGAWRAWKRWSRKTACGQAHDLVCDLCHEDAHVQSRLPVTEDLKELAMLQYDDELPPQRDPFLKNFLEEERRHVVSDAEERKEELRFLVGVRKSELDDEELERLFQNHLHTLPAAERPSTKPQERRLFIEWEYGLRQELDGWARELTALESQPVNGQRVFINARDRLMRLFESEAREAELLPRSRTQDSRLQAATPPGGQPCLCGCGGYPASPRSRYLPGHDARHQSQLKREAVATPKAEAAEHSVQLPSHSGQTRSGGGWYSLSHIAYSKGNRAPTEMRFPDGSSVRVNAWYDLMVETTRWLTNNNHLERRQCPISVSRKRNLVSTTPFHQAGNPMRSPKEVNSLYVEVHYDASSCVQNARTIVKWVGQDSAQFEVRFG